MSRKKIDSIVRFLSISGEIPQLPESFACGSAREWRDVLRWLDASGLALYFLRRLERSKRTDAVPEHLLMELHKRQRNNRERTSRMKATFELLNRRFRDAGIMYAVLKGYSLIPNYCPDASLRLQSDLDYLITRNSKDAASRILADQGYLRRPETGEEVQFSIPGQEPTERSLQYDPNSPYAIELQCSVWDHGFNDYPVLTRNICFEQIQFRESEGLLFPVLPEEEIFIGQVLHAFTHLMRGGVRASWMLELAYFVKHYRDNASFWRNMSSLSESDPMLGEIVGLIIGLAAKAFADTHSLPRRWTKPLNPMLLFWVEKYGREFVLEACPGYRPRLFSVAKLVLFLKPRYSAERQSRFQFLRHALLPAEGLRRLAQRPRRPLSKVQLVRKNARWLASRLAYHFGSNIRYLWETPSWYRMNKASISERELVSNPSRTA